MTSIRDEDNDGSSCVVAPGDAAGGASASANASGSSAGRRGRSAHWLERWGLRHAPRSKQGPLQQHPQLLLARPQTSDAAAEAAADDGAGPCFGPGGGNQLHSRSSQLQSADALPPPQQGPADGRQPLSQLIATTAAGGASAGMGGLGVGGSGGRSYSQISQRLQTAFSSLAAREMPLLLAQVSEDASVATAVTTTPTSRVEPSSSAAAPSQQHMLVVMPGTAAVHAPMLPPALMLPRSSGDNNASATPLPEGPPPEAAVAAAAAATAAASMATAAGGTPGWDTNASSGDGGPATSGARACVAAFGGCMAPELVNGWSAGRAPTADAVTVVATGQGPAGQQPVQHQQQHQQQRPVQQPMQHQHQEVRMQAQAQPQMRAHTQTQTRTQCIEELWESEAGEAADEDGMVTTCPQPAAQQTAAPAAAAAGVGSGCGDGALEMPEVWHEVVVSSFNHPDTGDQLLMVKQVRSCRVARYCLVAGIDD